MKEYVNQKYEGERCLFNTHGAKVVDCVFEDGESPLKESSELELINTKFNWKYPLWYTRNVSMKDCLLTDTARAGIWYVEHFTMENSFVAAAKTFRKMKDIKLTDVFIPNALETLWFCRDVELNNVQANGDYFGMDCHNVKLKSLTLHGNYCFDGGSDIEARNCVFMSKDCFWNCENVTVYDSRIVGEYFAWNSKNVTLVNCTIESLQGLCYIENLKMVNCKLINTDLAFEYCKNIDAEIVSTVISIKNPISGVIRCKGVGEIILDDDRVNHDDTRIIVED